MDSNILPDSRPRETKGVVRGQWQLGYKYASLNWVPIFCANCGKPQGYVPEENCSFACWLCDDCAETYGNIAGTMLMPDEEFWMRVAAEQLNKYGRYLSADEWRKIGEDINHPLQKLLREQPK